MRHCYRTSHAEFSHQDDRRVLNGIFYILCIGSRGRDLPERYGPYTAARNRFNRWAKMGAG